jgi:hypothetical protein
MSTASWLAASASSSLIFSDGLNGQAATVVG